MLHHGRKGICRYCFTNFQMPGEYVKLKNFERKTKAQIMIYSDFENILAQKDSGKQNPESVILTNIKNILLVVMVISVFVDDNFSKSFKPYLGQDLVYNFINSMIAECQYCSEVMKTHFKQELVMNKEYDEDFGRYTKC